MCAVSVTELHDLFAALAIAAMAGTVALVVLKVVSFAAPNTFTFRALDLAHKVQLPLAALVATVTTLGSLYFSEYGLMWEPCRFCWFQRIFMYPSAVLLLVATFRRDRNVKWYVGALSVIGLLISGWHNLLEHRIVEESAAFSASGPPCASPNWVSFGTFGYDKNGFYTTGFPITLAVMAFTAFAFILALLFLPEPLDTLDTLDTSDTLEDGNGEPAAG